MKRRVLTWGVLLAISVLMIIKVQGSYAEQDGITGRFKTVEVQTTQYIWDLVSNRDGHFICQVIVNHTGHPTNEEAIQICADQIYPVTQTPTPQPTPDNTPEPNLAQGPFNLADFFQSVFWRFVNTQELTRSIQVPLPEIIVNLTVPPNQPAPFYFAIIAAYEPVYGQRIDSLSGVINGVQFTCPFARCRVPVQGDSTIEFWATSSFGDDSRHMQAVLQVVQKDKAMTLQLASLIPATIFRDSCSVAWGLPQANQPAWSDFPTTPEELNTKKPYQYLAGKLLASGVVNASNCPGGGLMASGAPNTCGLEQSSQAVIDWQNQYDVAIWEGGRDVGIPPRMLKTLMGQESQFWPGNSRNIYNEYGLGQISQSGADVALRWDNELFGNICSGLLYDCSDIYGRMSSWMQATMRGGLMLAVNAECPTCPHGIDLERAYESIPIVAQTLRSNCYQVNYLTSRYHIIASYEDLWRYTLVSYHSGYECLKNALVTTEFNHLPGDWGHVSAYLDCPGAIYYVQEFWKSLVDFDTFRLSPVEVIRPVNLATLIVPPTPTRAAPTSTPTPVLSLSHIRVLVYVDSNQNNYPEDEEKVEGMQVTATFPGGQVLNGTTTNGEVVFDLTGRPVNSDVIVALPELYRSQKVRVMRDGEMPVIFRLEQPVVPPALP